MTELKIRREYCKGCNLCTIVCKKGVLELGTEINKKGNNYVIAKHMENCVACKACTIMCPEAAIELYK